MSEEQLRFDRAGILRELPRLVAAQGSRTQRGARRSPLRLLVELAAEAYFIHHGNARGFASFVRSLAKEAGIPCTSAKVRSTIKEAREEMNRRSKLPTPKNYVPAFDDPLRAIKRGDILDTHVVRLATDGDVVLGGYQPSRDPDIDAAKVFARFFKK